jgi:hypothetical protein
MLLQPKGQMDEMCVPSEGNDFLKIPVHWAQCISHSRVQLISGLESTKVSKSKSAKYPEVRPLSNEVPYISLQRFQIRPLEVLVVRLFPEE